MSILLLIQLHGLPLPAIDLMEAAATFHVENVFVGISYIRTFYQRLSSQYSIFEKLLPKYFVSDYSLKLVFFTQNLFDVSVHQEKLRFTFG